MNDRTLRISLILSALLTYTTYKAIQLWPTQRLAAAALALVVFGVMISSLFILRANPHAFETTWFRAFSWTSSLTMGLWATFILISIPLDVVRLVMALLVKLPAGNALDSSRRALLSQGMHVSLFAASGAITALGLWQVIKGPKVKETAIQIPSLLNSFQGLRIAQLSDLHVGPTIRKGYVEEVVRRTNETNADIVVLTGDLADAHVPTIAEHLKPLGDLKARYGCFYVTGNHEYYWGAEAMIGKMAELGFKPLLNENAILKVGDHSLMIAGVTDPAGENLSSDHTPDPRRAIAGAGEAQLKILLAHRPDACLDSEELGFDVQLSGHTHAGQFFPFSLFIGLAHKYPRGLNRHGDTWVHVNPGTGYWGPAHRFGVQSEISLLVLEKA